MVWGEDADWDVGDGGDAVFKEEVENTPEHTLYIVFVVKVIWYFDYIISISSSFYFVFILFLTSQVYIFEYTPTNAVYIVC